MSNLSLETRFGIIKDGCGHTGHTTLKLTVSQGSRNKMIFLQAGVQES